MSIRLDIWYSPKHDPAENYPMLVEKKAFVHLSLLFVKLIDLRSAEMSLFTAQVIIDLQFLNLNSEIIINL